jgi:TPR repeat protein
MFYAGHGVEKDKAEAARLFSIAAKQGEPEAKFLLGQMYFVGDGVAINRRKARELFEQVRQGRTAELSEVAAQVLLREEVEKEMVPMEKIQEDVEAWVEANKVNEEVANKLRRLLRDLEERGTADNKFEVALMYLRGDGVFADAMKGVRLLRQAADQGNVEAQYTLGLRLLMQGGSSVLGEAAENFSLAASQGHLAATYWLGVMYENGGGVEKDFKRAKGLITEAADRGFAEAQYKLAMWTLGGKEKQEEGQEAPNKGIGYVLDLLNAASDQGHVNSKFQLGMAYLTGATGDVDAVKAEKFLKEAADLGCGSAQYNLAEMYWKGLGVPINRREARKLYGLASKNGVKRKGWCTLF